MKYVLIEPGQVYQKIESYGEGYLFIDQLEILLKSLLSNQIYPLSYGSTGQGDKSDFTKVISKLIRDEFVRPLSEKLSLDPKITKELVEQYFQDDEPGFMKIVQCEQKIEGIRQQVQLTQKQDQWMVEKVKRLLEVKKEQINEAHVKIIQFYFQERQMLLINLKLIVQGGLSGSIPCLSHILTLMVTQGLVGHLIQSLKRNTASLRTEFRFDEEVTQRRVLQQVLTEQIHTLEILFSISTCQDLTKSLPSVTLKNFIAFFEYLKDTEFEGTIPGETQAQTRLFGYQAVSDLQMVQTGKIKDLGLLTALAFLRTDLFLYNSKERAKEFTRTWFQGQTCEEDLRRLSALMLSVGVNQVNSVIGIAVYLVIGESEKQLDLLPGKLIKWPNDFEKNLRKENYMLEIDRLVRQSFLLSSAGFQSSGKVDDSVSMSGEILKILKNFILIVYNGVLVRDQKYEDIYIVQQLMLNVLIKNPQTLKDIWMQMERGMSEVGQSEDKYATIRMFSEDLKRPFQNLNLYTFLILSMSGNNKVRTAEKAYKFLATQEVWVGEGDLSGEVVNLQQIQQNRRGLDTKPMIDELLVGYLVLLNQLVSNQMGDNQTKFDSLVNISVLVAKIIKQSPLLIFDLNQKFKRIIEGLSVDRDHGLRFAISSLIYTNASDLEDAVGCLIDPVLQFDSPIEGMEGNQVIKQNPLLVLIVSALFIFMRMESPNLTSSVVKHNLDVLSALMEVDTFKKSIVDLVHMQQEMEGQFDLSAYVARNFLEFEVRTSEFKVTQSYLKFMASIFSLQLPQLLLNQQKQTNLDSSILGDMLIVYRKIFSAYRDLSFSSIGQFAKFGIRLFEVLQALLAKFDSGSLCPLRIEVCLPNPRFDQLMNLIKDLLNDLPLATLWNSLKPEESQTIRLGVGSRYECLQNCLIAHLIPKHSTSPSVEVQLQMLRQKSYSHDKFRVNLLINSTLKCLNQMARLSLQRELNQNYLQKVYGQQSDKIEVVSSHKDHRGLKLFYIDQLHCVHELTNQLLQIVTQQDIFEDVNLVSLVALYAFAEIKQMSQSQNQTHVFTLSPNPLVSLTNNTAAVEFLKQIVQLWQIQNPVQRIDLSLLLCNKGFVSQDHLPKVFLGPLIASLQSLEVFARQGTNQLVQLSLKSVQMKFAIQMTEFLTVCAQSQHSLLNILFDSSLALDYLVPEIQKWFKPSHEGQESLLSGFEKDQLLREQALSLTQKLVSLLQVISSEHVAYQFILRLFGIRDAQSKIGNSDFIRQVVASFISPICLRETVIRSNLNPYLLPESYFDPAEGLFDYYSQRAALSDDALKHNPAVLEQFHFHLISVVSLSEFLQLVQNIYAIDTQSNDSIKSIICDLFSNDSFGEFLDPKSTLEIEMETERAARNLQFIGQMFKNEGVNEDQSMREEIQEEFRSLSDTQFRLALKQTEQILKSLSSEQVQANQYNHEYASAPNQYSKIAPISLAPISCLNLVNCLEFLKTRVSKSQFLCSLTQHTNLPGHWPSSEPTCLGPNFAIASDDLQYSLLTNGYHNLRAVSEYVTQTRIFNLCVSTAYLHQILIEAKNNFLNSVGKAKLSYLIRNSHSLPLLPSQDKGQPKEQGMSFKVLGSLFTLVDKEFPKMKKTELNLGEIKQNVGILVSRLLRLCQGVVSQLKEETEQQRELQNNLVLQNLSDAKLSYLQTLMASLNMCVTESSLKGLVHLDTLRDKSQLERFITIELLPSLCRIFSFHINQQKRDSPSQLAKSQYLQQMRFQQITLSSFQILDCFGGKLQQSGGILEACNRISQIMQAQVSSNNETGDGAKQTKGLFKDCIKTLQAAIDLVNEESVQHFMNKMSTQPLRTIIQRLIDCQATDISESIVILQFLTSYATRPRGSLHLYGENILQHLVKIRFLSRISSSFYSSSSDHNEQRVEKRDLHHILWCQVLVLLTTLNGNLMMEDETFDLIQSTSNLSYADQVASNFDVQVYIKQLLAFFQSMGVYQRLHFILALPATDQVMHQAYFEEAELTLELISHICLQVDCFNQISNGLILAIKDSLVFGFANIFKFIGDIGQRTKPSLPATTLTEKFLLNQQAVAILRDSQSGKDSGVFQGGRHFSLLDMKAQVHAVKFYVTFCGSLINLLLEDKNMGNREGLRSKSQIFPINWEYLVDRLNNSTQHADFNKTYFFKDQGHELRKIVETEGSGQLAKMFMANIFEAHDSIRSIYNQWNSNLNETRTIFNALLGSFANDESVSAEYHGLNFAFIVAQGGQNEFDQLMQCLEDGIQMGNQLLVLSLEKIKDHYFQISQTRHSFSSLTQRDVIECSNQCMGLLALIEKDIQLAKDNSQQQKQGMVAHIIQSKSFIAQVIDAVQGGTGQFYGGASLRSHRNLGYYQTDQIRSPF